MSGAPKNVSDTNVSQFAQPKKHQGQQCVRNKVSSFTRAFKLLALVFSEQIVNEAQPS